MDLWHWCANCPDWPTGSPSLDYLVSQTPPSARERDPECARREKDGQCIGSSQL